MKRTMMALGIGLFAATPVLAADAAASFQSAATSACEGREMVVELPAAELTPQHDGASQWRHWIYPMAFRQITEGWNWHPEAAQRGGDYYLFNYLPLASVDEWRGRYQGEDKIGRVQEFAVHWRYDYFAGFDNIERFVAPQAGDEAGFDFELPADLDPRNGVLRAALALAAPCTAESTTFWKATHAQPEDFTLKKRYLLGHLLRLELIAADTTYAARTRDTAAH